MALTTLLLHLQKAIRTTARESLLFSSIVLGLMFLCLPLITGCSDGVDSANGAGIANPGNGNAYGLDNNPNRTSTMGLSPTGLAFSATQGGSNPVPQTVTISNSGTSTLDWSASTTAAWLSLSSTSGTAPTSFTATINISGLAAGTYSTTITVSATGATNTPQSIPVDLTISTATSGSSTAAVILTWNPVQDSNLTGYYVHFGTQSANSAGSCTYTQSTFYSLASLSNTTSPMVTLTGLSPNTTYFFAVSAYNGKESACSNEVSTFAQLI